jgi:hypothetical protein
LKRNLLQNTGNSIAEEVAIGWFTEGHKVKMSQRKTQKAKRKTQIITTPLPTQNLTLKYFSNTLNISIFFLL